MRDNEKNVRPINWNNVPEFERTIFDTLVTNFWVPERINMSADLASWRKLSAEEQTLVLRVFAGLTLLDTIQGTVGAKVLMDDAKNPFEEAILSNIVFMETIHAKSYSNIFSTLSNTESINAAFEWSEENDYLQFKARKIVEIYDGDDEAKRKIASTFLESGLFFSGFGLPFWLAGHGKLMNTADMIRLILRDENIHGHAIGQWFQRNVREHYPEREEELREFAYDLAEELYENEDKYTRSLYDSVGLTNKILPFVQYNFNKALQNLGFDPLFGTTIRDIDPILATSMSTESETGDFFSGATTYALGKTEQVSDDDFDDPDWNF